MYNSTPMPGESLESAEARERARREQEAIANGESFNPYYSAEEASGFESLGDAVPFAGDITEGSLAETAIELAVEDETSVAAGVAAQEGLNLVGNIIEDTLVDTESESYSDMEASAQETKKHDSDNAIAQKFNEQWDQDKIPDLDDIQESVERDYISGAVEQSAMNPDAQADMANTERFSTEQHNDEESAVAGFAHEQVADQPHDLAESAAIQAVAVAAKSEEVAEGIRNGDENAMSEVNAIQERAAAAANTASEVITSAMRNSDDELEVRKAIDVATQAQEKAAEAVANVHEAEAEYNSMTEEQKEEVKEAAEAAEANGTTVEEEKAKIETAKKEAEAEGEFSEAGAEYSL
ncbi:MAG: hypothetical protein MJ154_00565 [Candidatus Saccharibacteria bacterium]|nr:hypothetical protein [Candidatus Saccharibacteria bacterium]